MVRDADTWGFLAAIVLLEALFIFVLWLTRSSEKGLL
jgi:hypothetical protein